MPIAFAPLFAFAIGAAFAWLAAPELGSDEGPVALSRPFAIVAAFAALVWAPVVGYFVAFHGDWSYLYVVPWRRVPSAVDLLLSVLAGVTVVAGFVAAAGPVRRRHFGAVVAMVTGPATVGVIGLTAAAHRLAVSATYAQYHGDFGVEPIGASLLGKGVLLFGVLLAAAVAWTARALLRLTSG
jgi:hypothetical protein